jgi:hypothetical protein
MLGASSPKPCSAYQSSWPHRWRATCCGWRGGAPPHWSQPLVIMSFLHCSPPANPRLLDNCVSLTLGDARRPAAAFKLQPTRRPCIQRSRGGKRTGRRYEPLGLTLPAKKAGVVRDLASALQCVGLGSLGSHSDESGAGWLVIERETGIKGCQAACRKLCLAFPPLNVKRSWTP